MAYAAKKKKRGLSKIKVLLVTAILFIIGFICFYVYNVRKQALKTLDSANAITAQTIPPKHKGLSVLITENWNVYSNQQGSFSLKYPNSWVLPSDQKLCPAGTFDRSIFLGPNASSVLKCGYYNRSTMGQVVVASYIGDQRSNYEMNGENFSNVQHRTLSIDGVLGEKETATVNNLVISNRRGFYAQNSLSDTNPLSLSTATMQNKTFIERYIFYANNNTYVAQYIKAPSGTSNSSNVLAYFDLMVSKTLKFHS